MLALRGKPILQHSFDIVAACDDVREIVLAVTPEMAADPPGYLRHDRKTVHVVEGGPRRQDSVARAFAHISPSAQIIVIHDAVRPLASADLFSRVIAAAAEAGSAIAAIPSRDTVKISAPGATSNAVVAHTISRDRVYLAQTPQAFSRQILADILGSDRGADATDEAVLAERAGHPVRLVEGEPRNLKITTEHDLRLARALTAGPSDVRIGTGYDLHRLEPGRTLILGGVEVPHTMGLAGHSDADVLSHAITDAILGAAGAGDIGQHFADTDPQWKGASSIDLLRRAVEIIRRAGCVVSNVDAVIIAERPRLAPHIPAMRERLAAAMNIAASAVSVKGKTNEGVGECGRNEAIAVHAVAMVTRM
jgi:2-C-methyl-D-erythritol 4-phosphate cytidylyltransferase/2-C-methyl-D-erythritol 2,4-cyclodiphosphate synthase